MILSYKILPKWQKIAMVAAILGIQAIRQALVASFWKTSADPR